MRATTWTSCPNWFWYPPAIQEPSAPVYGEPRIRVNMNPPVIVREVTMVMIAQVQRFCRTGAMNRRVRAKPKSPLMKVIQRAQSMGALYGIGMGVWLDKCWARGSASNPLKSVLSTDGYHELILLLGEVVFGRYISSTCTRTFRRTINPNNRSGGQIQL